MLKKICAVIFLSVAIIFVTGQNQVEAREVYVGSYSDGTAVYLLTESIAHGARGVNCTVRAGRDYLTYWLGWYNSKPYYRNNEGYEGYVFDGRSPVAAAIWNYCM